MQKTIDVMIVTMYILFSLLSAGFVVYAGWCVIQSNNITAITSIGVGCISFAMSVYIAKAFRL